MESNYDHNNVYAKTLKEQVIHVSEALSGRKGYYCLGCDNQLEAVISKLQNRISYFRHVPSDVKTERKCVYKDETYRHQLAKEILLQLKYIKVPALYKYAPKGTDGRAMFLRDAEIIEAHSIRIELTFYEDEDGTIKWGSNKEVDEKYLLIRPDVIFFDGNGNPILFIELEATNAISPEKQAKLRRLGINTVRVKIPKDSPASIEQSFKNTNRTLWVYNYEEERTQYVYVPKGRGEVVSQADEQQRVFFEESFKCRQAEINNLIRTLKRCLESKPYFTTENGLRAEISRVTGNTAEHQSRLESLRARAGSAISKRIKLQMEEFENENTRFSGEEEKFSRDFRDLEKRYHSKKSALDREEREIDREINGEVESETGNGNSLEARRRGNRRIALDIRLLMSDEESEIRRIERQFAGIPELAKAEEIKLHEGFEYLAANERAEIERIERERAHLPAESQSKEENLPGEFRSEEEKLSREFNSKEKGIIQEFEESRKLADETISTRNVSGSTELSRRIRDLFYSREQLKDIQQITANSRRNRKAWESFKEGTYETWFKREGLL